MDEGFVMQQDQVLARFASLLSSVLTVNEHGGLVHYPESQSSSEQLLQLISPLVTNDEVFCSIPSLSLKKQRAPSATREKASLEIAAASSLAELEEVSKMEVRNLPSTLVRNIVKSFMSLVESRVRSYLTALSLQSKKDPSGRLSPIVEMLSGMPSRLVKPNTIVSSVRVMGASTRANDKWISPLVQETVIDLNVLGEVISVILSGSGSICGLFDDSSGAPRTLTKVSLFIDTTNFLRSMMAKARDVVKRATSKISHLYLNSMTQSAQSISYSYGMERSNLLERNQQMSFPLIRTPNGDTTKFNNSGMPPPMPSAQTVSHGMATSDLRERNQQMSFPSIRTPNSDATKFNNSGMPPPMQSAASSDLRERNQQMSFPLIRAPNGDTTKFNSGMPPPMQSAQTVSHGMTSSDQLERNQQMSFPLIRTPNGDLPVPSSNLEFNSVMPPPRRRDPSSISLQSFPQPEKHQNHYHSDERKCGLEAGQQLEDTNKGLDLLTRAAISLKHSHETESLRPAKYQRQMGIPGHSNGIYQEIPKVDEV